MYHLQENRRRRKRIIPDHITGSALQPSSLFCTFAVVTPCVCEVLMLMDIVWFAMVKKISTGGMKPCSKLFFEAVTELVRVNREIRWVLGVHMYKGLIDIDAEEGRFIGLHCS